MVKCRTDNQVKPQSGAAVRTVFACAGLLLGMILAFWLALAAVYAIPSQLLEAHAKDASEILQSEGNTPTSYANGGYIDNYTVAIMISEAVYPSDDPLSDALRSQCWLKGDLGYDPVVYLAAGLSDADDVEQASSCYYTYWHGYLVILKPLLVFMGLYSIRSLFQGIFVALLALFAVLSVRRLGKTGALIGVSAIMSYLALGCLDASTCLPFFFSFALGVAGMIAMLYIDIHSMRRLAMMFLAIGALTVFFDFLDNPIMTLGFPLVVFVVRAWGDSSLGGWQLVKCIVLLCVAWGVGYGGAWIGKWAIASVVLGENVFENALASAELRSGTLSVDGWIAKYMMPLRANLSTMGRPLLMALAVIVGAAVVLAVRNKQRGLQPVGAVWIYACLALVAALPGLWMLVFNQHSCVHSVFVYRDFAVSVFCVLCLASLVVSEWWAAKRRKG